MKKNNRESLLVIHKGLVVDAIYRMPEIPDFEGIPLIEALPPVLTPEQAAPRINFYPDYYRSHSKAPDHIRRLLIQNGMRFFASLDIHVDLEQRFSCLMRMGYLSRNPLSSGFWPKVSVKVDSLSQYGSQYGDWDGDSSWTASGFSIVGISGVGKSRSVLRILNLYPQVIRHNHFRGRNFTHMQLVWLKLECPFDGNPRGLCIGFFKVVDSILGTNYKEEYVRERRIQDELLSDMATIAANHFLGVLVIDEIQRLNLAKSGGADKMLNFFVHLINTIGVPVVLIGTYKAMTLLSGEFSQMRRGTGQGDLIWDRMANDEQWKLFVESLWRFQYTKKESPLTPELSDVLYEETQGITDFAIKVYMFAQERAIDSGKEMITSSIIRSAAKDKLCIPRAILNALKAGNKTVLEQFEDVYPRTLKDCLAESPNSYQIIGKIEAAPEIQVITSSYSQSPDAKQFRESQLIQGSSKENSTNHAQKENTGNRTPRRRRTKESLPVKGELPSVIAALESKDAMAAYDALKRAGHIRCSNEFLPEQSSK
jgi:hypothetical protein